MDALICPNCNIDMVPEAVVNQKKRGKYGSYKIQRFRCDVCDYVETKWGRGLADGMNTHDAISDVKKMYRQQEENND